MVNCPVVLKNTCYGIGLARLVVNGVGLARQVVSGVEEYLLWCWSGQVSG